MRKHDGVRLDTETYRCRYARRQGNFCSVLMKVIYNKQTGETKVSQRGEHEHPQPKANGFTSEERFFMKEKVAARFTPGQIQDAFIGLIFIMQNVNKNKLTRKKPKCPKTGPN